MTALSDLLNDAKGDRSVDDLIDSAEKRLGRTIHRTFRSTIYKALDGDHARNPREATLQLFADVFGVDIRTLRQAADKPAGELDPWVPPAESNRLDRDQRRALEALIKAIVQGGKAHGNAAATTRDSVTEVDFKGLSSSEAQRAIDAGVVAARERDELPPPAPTDDESQDPGNIEPA